MLVNARDRERRKIPVYLDRENAVVYRATIPTPQGFHDEWPLTPGTALGRLPKARILPVESLQPLQSGRHSPLIAIHPIRPPDPRDRVKMFVAAIYWVRNDPHSSSRIWVAELRCHCQFDSLDFSEHGFPKDEGAKEVLVLDEAEALDWLAGNKFDPPPIAIGSQFGSLPSAQPIATETEERPHLTLAETFRVDRPRSAKIAAFLEYMENRITAEFDDIVEVVHGDEQTSPEAIRQLVRRTNLYLEEKRSEIRFECGSGRVIKQPSRQ